MSEVQTYLEIYEDEDACLNIYLNRPEKKNALCVEMMEALKDVFHKLQTRDDLRLVILRGKGDVFCSGADLKWMQESQNFNQEENLIDARKLAALFKSIDDCPLPLLGGVQGAALGGGAGLCSCMDICIATEDCRFGFPELQIGLLPAVISPFVMSKINYSKALELFLTGRRFDAKEAYENGLVKFIADRENLEQKIDKVKQMILNAGPEATKKLKSMLKEEYRKIDIEMCLERMCKNIAEVRVSSEAQEGLKAIFEKRSPNWRKTH